MVHLQQAAGEHVVMGAVAAALGRVKRYLYRVARVTEVVAALVGPRVVGSIRVGVYEKLGLEGQS